MAVVNNIKKIETENLANEMNFYTIDLPADVKLEGKKLVANYILIFMLFFFIPMSVSFIYIKDISMFLAKVLNITKDSPNFLYYVWLIIIYGLYGLLSAGFLWLYDKYIKRFHKIDIDEEYLKYQNLKININKIYYCKAIKDKIKIYWEGEKEFWVDVFRLKNEAAAYALCLKIKNIKGKLYKKSCNKL